MPGDNFMWIPNEATGGSLKNKANKPEGETTDKVFSAKKAFEIMSFSFGIEQAETSGSASTGAGAGKAKFTEFEIKKGVDLASVPIFMACAAGAHFPNVCIAVRKAGGSALIYLQYIFRQVYVINIGWSGGGGDAAPEETIKFKFNAMGIRYVQQDAKGGQKTKIEGMWSTSANDASLAVPGLPPAPAYIDNK